mmetsp:Transcript_7831/g.24417  ORF Transcript_7831/g.24417 Transcript_7831/m.24417 type:complete len:215 (-) Transcript_7831:431-1075(-)
MQLCALREVHRVDAGANAARQGRPDDVHSAKHEFAFVCGPCCHRARAGTLPARDEECSLDSVLPLVAAVPLPGLLLSRHARVPRNVHRVCVHDRRTRRRLGVVPVHIVGAAQARHHAVLGPRRASHVQNVQRRASAFLRQQRHRGHAFRRHSGRRLPQIARAGLQHVQGLVRTVRNALDVRAPRDVRVQGGDSRCRLVLGRTRFSPPHHLLEHC